MTYISNDAIFLMKASAGSEFISSLCDALECEYSLTVPTNKRDLVQLFTSVIIPRVGRFSIPEQSTNRTIKQTPESRSSLTKTIRFQSYHFGVSPRLVYAGEKDDKSFNHARNYYIELGY